MPCNLFPLIVLYGVLQFVQGARSLCDTADMNNYVDYTAIVSLFPDALHALKFPLQTVKSCGGELRHYSNYS